MQPDLSIVMAVADDYDGVYFTIQALRLYHDLRRCEIVVVDNKPDTPAGQKLAEDFTRNKYSRGTMGARYVAFPEPAGTAPAKGEAIRQANGKAVLCIDAHVMLPAGAIKRLLDWFDAHPESKDIVTGPILLDQLDQFDTHFNPVWRGEMFGTWGRAYEANGERFSVIEGPEGSARFVRIDRGNELVDANWSLPIKYDGHGAELRKAGCVLLGSNPDDELEVPGMGCGLMAFRKEAWPGFNPHFRGFGGEEMYIHEKFRRQGGKCLCLGFLKWVHRFGKPGGIKYKVTRWDKVRNYVLGHQELRLPIQPIHDAFVDTGLITAAGWMAIISQQQKETPPPETIESMYAEIKSRSKYWAPHMDTIRDLSSGRDVIEISRYPETCAAIAAGKPSRHESYHYTGSDFAVISKLAPMQLRRVNGPDDVAPRACDLLVYKTPHNHETLAVDLQRWAPFAARVVLHDTQRTQLRLENGAPGHGPMIKEFLDQHPDWFIASHSKDATGLTVLSRVDSEKPTDEIKLWAKGYGPGTQMKGMLSGLGIQPDDKCPCRRIANYMDEVGVEGCRREREQIKEQILKGYEKWKWKDKLAMYAAGTLSLLKGGIAWKVDPTDPVGSMIDIAIEREEQRLTASPTAPQQSPPER